MNDRYYPNRCAKLSSRILDKHIPSILKSRQLRKKVLQKYQTDIILPQQIRSLSFLLGFDDPRYVEEFDGPYGNRINYYRQNIENAIRSVGYSINLSKFNIKDRCNSNRKNYAFEVNDVERAFIILDKKGVIDYNPDSFREALILV